jgi:hypothetical protein
MNADENRFRQINPKNKWERYTREINLGKDISDIF